MRVFRDLPTGRIVRRSGRLDGCEHKHRQNDHLEIIVPERRLAQERHFRLIVQECGTTRKIPPIEKVVCCSLDRFGQLRLRSYYC